MFRTTTKYLFYFVDPTAERVVSPNMWSLERPCGTSGPLTFVHFESPDVSTALFRLPYTGRIVHFCCLGPELEKNCGVLLSAVIFGLSRYEYRWVCGSETFSLQTLNYSSVPRPCSQTVCSHSLTFFGETWRRIVE